MTITNRVSLKSVNGGNTPIADVVDAPTIGTATAGAELATVAYTAAATGGAATSFTAISTPGSITGTGASPITVSGLTGGTAYTFKVYGTNASGVWTATQSSASNSVTPAIATSFESITTTTVGAGGTSSITFSSIPSTYSHLQIRLFGQTNRPDVSRDNYRITLNGDTGSNYSYHGVFGTGASVGSYAAANATFIQSNTLGALGYFGASIVDILEYTNTNTFKTLRCIGGVNDNTAGWTVVDFDSGNWRNTSAITSITLTPGGGGGSNAFVQYTHAALYGIKG